MKPVPSIPGGLADPPTKEKPHPVEPWPDDYFEQIFGRGEGQRLERDAQGAFKRRIELR